MVLVLPRSPKNLKGLLKFKLRRGFGFKSKPCPLSLKNTKLYTALFLCLAITTTSFLVNNFIPLAFLLLSIAIPLVSTLRDKVAESIRKHNVENELPFFSLLASTLSHAGQTLVKAFNIVAEAKVFPAFSLEALYLKKESLFMGGDTIAAMSNYAQRHPSRLLSSLILGYVGIVRSGGDVTKYLEEKTRELFSMLKERWNNFVNNVSTVGEAMLALFLIMPLMLSMTTLVFASEVEEAIYELMILGLVPLLSLMTVFLLHVTRPQDSFEYMPSGKIISSSTISIITSTLILGILFNKTILDLIAFGTIAAILPLTIHYEKEKAKVLEIEKEIPRFLRYLGEHKKLGFSLLTVLEKSSREPYNKAFSLIIKEAIGKMKLGLSLYQSIVALKVRSKLCKIVLFILDSLVESGGGSPATFEILASYVDEYNKQRSKVKRSLHLYSLLGYASPMILAICLSLTTTFIVGMNEQPTLNVTEGVSNMIQPPQEEVHEVLFYSKLMMLVSSISMGLILGKAIEGSMLCTKHTLICILVALISLNSLL
ncbi:MAG: type II secretion system F family protein [Candidatus Nezhaarchaeales archaeon]